MSKLYFRYGAMNCGKSTLILQAAHNYEERGMKVKIIKSSKDKKADDCIYSRVGVKRKVDYLAYENDDLKNYLASVAALGDISCVIVDEAQFLTEKQVENLWAFTKAFDIPVMAFGLRNDFQTYMFAGCKRLFELADVIEEPQHTICRCGKRAKFNARIENGDFTFEGNQVAIDGIDASYESLCGDCYYKKVLKNNPSKYFSK